MIISREAGKGPRSVFKRYDRTHHGKTRRRRVVKYLAKPLLVTLAVISPIATADLLECVDPDIAAVFLHSGYSPAPVITREMPDSFPDFRHPKEFSFIGSSTRPNSIMIAYKTDLSLQLAEEEMASALEDSGFKRQPKQHRPSQGFQTRKNFPLSLSLCGDDDAPPIHVATRSEPTSTFVTVIKTVSRSGQMLCRDMGSLLDQLARRFMPDLKLPPDSSHAMSSGGGGSNDSASTHVRFRTSYDLSQLVAFFNTQIADQDWSLEGDWTSSLGNGSIWSAARDGYRLSANLQLVGHAPKEYTAVFSIWQFEGEGKR